MNKDELAKYLEVRRNNLTEKEFLDLIFGLLENNPSEEESDLLYPKLMAYSHLDKDRVVRHFETLLHDPRPVYREYAALHLHILSDGPNSQAHKILTNYLGEEIKDGEEVDQILKRYHAILPSQDESNGQLPIRSLTMTIDKSQREELFKQLRIFADRHSFKYEFTDFNTNGENFQFWMVRDDMNITTANVSPDPKVVFIDFDRGDPGRPVNEKDVNELFTALKNLVSEIPTVTITGEK